MNPYQSIDIDLLRCFQEVAVQKNFTVAADKLYRTQSAVSMKIKRLEELTGRQLLIRTSRSFQLTQAGEALLVYAQQLTGLHQQMQDWLDGPTLIGKLTLGIAEHTAQIHLARMLASFRRMFPQVEVFAEVGLSEHLLKKLKQGQLDVVIAQPYGDYQPDLILQREKMVWVAGLNYHPDLTKPLPLALLPDPCSYRTAGIDGLERTGITYQIVITCTSLIGIQNLVAGNLAISILTRSSVTTDLQVLGARSGLPQLASIDTCLFRRNKGTSSIIEPFISFIQRQFNEGHAPLNDLSTQNISI